MNAGSPQKVGSFEDFINIVEQFHKKCENKTIQKNDVDQLVQIILDSRASLNAGGPKVDRLIGRLQQLGKNKEVIQAAAGAVPYANLTKAMDSLALYLKDQKNSQSKVMRADNEGLQKH